MGILQDDKWSWYLVAAVYNHNIVALFLVWSHNPGVAEIIAEHDVKHVQSSNLKVDKYSAVMKFGKTRPHVYMSRSLTSNVLEVII